MSETEVLLTHFRERGRLSLPQACRLLRRPAHAALDQLVRSGQVRHIPGGGCTRATRSGYYTLAPVRASHAYPLGILQDIARLLSGRSGTTGTLARQLQCSPDQAAALLTALVEQGMAHGAPVGATWAYRIPVTPP